MGQALLHGFVHLPRTACPQTCAQPAGPESLPCRVAVHLTRKQAVAENEDYGQYDMGEPGVNAWSITGTPTDCVRLGLFNLIQEPVDVLISGINDGYNAGMAVHYSGTVGAATEAALNRVRAMAVSVHHKADPALYDYVAHLAILTAEKYISLGIQVFDAKGVNLQLR